MQRTLHATHPTPHGASCLVQAMPAWSMNTQRAPPRYSRDARVYGHATTAMHVMSTPPPPASASRLGIHLRPNHSQLRTCLYHHLALHPRLHHVPDPRRKTRLPSLTEITRQKNPVNFLLCGLRPAGAIPSSKTVNYPVLSEVHSKACQGLPGLCCCLGVAL